MSNPKNRNGEQMELFSVGGITTKAKGATGAAPSQDAEQILSSENTDELVKAMEGGGEPWNRIATTIREHVRTVSPQAVEELIRRGSVSTETCYEDKKTGGFRIDLIGMLIKEGRGDVVLHLMDTKVIDRSYKETVSETGLIGMALFADDLELGDELRKRRVSASARNRNKVSPLSVAAQKGNDRHVIWLLDNGAAPFYPPEGLPERTFKILSDAATAYFDRDQTENLVDPAIRKEVMEGGAGQEMGETGGRKRKPGA